MRRFLFLLVLLGIIIPSLNAQKSTRLSVKSIELREGDLRPRTHPVLDKNDQPCALVVVNISPCIEHVVFEGEIIDNVEFDSATCDYKMYVPAGVRKKLRLKHRNYEPCDIDFTDFKIKKVQSFCVYEVIIKVDDGEDEYNKNMNEAKVRNSGIDITGFQGMLTLNTNFISSHGGIGLDLILGKRIKNYYFIGAGLSAHTLLDAYLKDYNEINTLYLNNVLYLPTKTTTMPFLEVALGAHFGICGISSTWQSMMYGFYFRSGLGIESRKFLFSLGYELVGTSTGYCKIGFKF